MRVRDRAQTCLIARADARSGRERRTANTKQTTREIEMNHMADDVCVNYSLLNLIRSMMIWCTGMLHAYVVSAVYVFWRFRCASLTKVCELSHSLWLLVVALLATVVTDLARLCVPARARSRHQNTVRFSA